MYPMHRLSHLSNTAEPMQPLSAEELSPCSSLMNFVCCLPHELSDTWLTMGTPCRARLAQVKAVYPARGLEMVAQVYSSKEAGCLVMELVRRAGDVFDFTNMRNNLVQQLGSNISSSADVLAMASRSVCHADVCPDVTSPRLNSCPSHKQFQQHRAVHHDLSCMSEAFRRKHSCTSKCPSVGFAISHVCIELLLRGCILGSRVSTLARDERYPSLCSQLTSMLTS